MCEECFLSARRAYPVKDVLVTLLSRSFWACLRGDNAPWPGIPDISSGTQQRSSEWTSAPRFPLKDGGGIHSSADWSAPQVSHDILRDLRHSWMQRAKSWNLLWRLRAHLDEKSDCALLTHCEIEMLRKDLACFLEAKGFPCSTAIPAFQPFALHLEGSGRIDCGPRH